MSQRDAASVSGGIARTIEGAEPGQNRPPVRFADRFPNRAVRRVRSGFNDIALWAFTEMVN